MVSYSFMLRKNDAMPIQCPKTLVCTSSLPILKSKMKDLKPLAKYTPESSIAIILEFFYFRYNPRQRKKGQI